MPLNTAPEPLRILIQAMAKLTFGMAGKDNSLRPGEVFYLMCPPGPGTPGTMYKKQLHL